MFILCCLSSSNALFTSQGHILLYVELTPQIKDNIGTKSQLEKNTNGKQSILKMFNAINGMIPYKKLATYMAFKHLNMYLNVILHQLLML